MSENRMPASMGGGGGDLLLVLRGEITAWEKSFKAANGGRKPAVDDIVAAGMLVKYKEYKKLKGAAAKPDSAQGSGAGAGAASASDGAGQGVGSQRDSTTPKQVLAPSTAPNATAAAAAAASAAAAADAKDFAPSSSSVSAAAGDAAATNRAQAQAALSEALRRKSAAKALSSSARGVCMSTPRFSEAGASKGAAGGRQGVSISRTSSTVPSLSRLQSSSSTAGAAAARNSDVGGANKGGAEIAFGKTTRDDDDDDDDAERELASAAMGKIWPKASRAGAGRGGAGAPPASASASGKPAAAAAAAAAREPHHDAPVTAFDAGVVFEDDDKLSGRRSNNAGNDTEAHVDFPIDESSASKTQDLDGIRRLQQDMVAVDQERKLKLESRYTTKRLHPLQEEAAKTRASGKPVVRENYVRLQTKGVKKFKGRGSKAGGTKNMGWTKGGGRYSKFGGGGGKFGGKGGSYSGKKGKCFKCGEAGHWATECPAERKADGLSDGEDGLEKILDEMEARGECEVPDVPKLSAAERAEREAREGRGKQNEDYDDDDEMEEEEEEEERPVKRRRGKKAKPGSAAEARSLAELFGEVDGHGADVYPDAGESSVIKATPPTLKKKLSAKTSGGGMGRGRGRGRKAKALLVLSSEEESDECEWGKEMKESEEGGMGVTNAGSSKAQKASVRTENSDEDDKHDDDDVDDGEEEEEIYIPRRTSRSRNREAVSTSTAASAKTSKSSGASTTLEGADVDCGVKDVEGDQEGEEVEEGERKADTPGGSKKAASRGTRAVKSKGKMPEGKAGTREGRSKTVVTREPASKGKAGGSSLAVGRKRKSKDTAAKKVLALSSSSDDEEDGEQEERGESGLPSAGDAERVDGEGAASGNPTPVSQHKMLKTLKKVFQHDGFRDGQELALKRVLSGQSTLFVSSTGGGKSLCYQLPAYHLKGTVLVVSPLLALIQDQLEGLPPGIIGATLNSQQSQTENDDVVKRLRAGEIQLLFVAPERLFTDGFQNLARVIPPFAMACIDEVHCMCEWAHNFRPSYLRLNNVLRNILNIQNILGLTATATRAMERDITHLLEIPQEGIIRSSLLRENLHIAVSRNDGDKNVALLDMLEKDPRFTKGSIIVYCTFRSQCEEVAKYLSNHSIKADYYHAARTTSARARVQKRFMKGGLRVVVATVAFGMGIDKNDVRGVIHFNCPSSVEAYVQEIGRAGRDGREAHCHLLLNDADVTRLRSYAHAEGVDHVSVRMLVDRMFQEANQDRLMYCSIPEVDEAKYDMSKESMCAVMAMLERKGLLHVCNNTAASVTVAFLTDQMHTLPKICRVVASIVKVGTRNNGQWTFDPCRVANDSGEDLMSVYRTLRMYKTKKILRVDYSKERALACLVTRKAGSALIEDEAREISNRLAELENRKVARIEVLWRILTEQAKPSWRDCAASVARKGGSKAAKKQQHGEGKDGVDADGGAEEGKAGNSNSAGGGKDESDGESELGGVLARYFDIEGDEAVEEILVNNKSGGAEGGDQSSVKAKAQLDRFVRADVISFCNGVETDNRLLTGRAVARIFHGIQSPAFPSKLWYYNPSWQRYVHTDFESIRAVADSVLAGLRGDKKVASAVPISQPHFSTAQGSRAQKASESQTGRKRGREPEEEEEAEDDDEKEDVAREGEQKDGSEEMDKGNAKVGEKDSAMEGVEMVDWQDRPAEKVEHMEKCGDGGVPAAVLDVQDVATNASSEVVKGENGATRGGEGETVRGREGEGGSVGSEELAGGQVLAGEGYMEEM